MFRTAALIAFLASASAHESLRADTTMGRALLKSATVVEEARALQNNYNYNGQQQNQNGERDASFLANYNIKYLGCSSTISYDQENNGGDENPLLLSNLVKFTLCENSCSSCSGQYVVGMQEFLQAYNEMQMNEQEYRCEMGGQAAQYAQCNYQDDQACQNEYFMNNGLEECVQYEGQEEFEMDRYLECGQVEYNNNNNGNGQNGYNYNNGQNGNNAEMWYEYFMGPYCADDGKSIKFRMYYDDGCTVVASGDHSSIFKTRTGFDIPSGMLSANTCFSCEDQEQAREQQYQQNQYQQNQNGNNQNGNWYYEKEVSQICQESYERAARCEKGMDLYYPDTTGCDFINVYLPKLEGASNALSRATSGASTGAAVGFAWVFGITTVLFGAYAYFLYRKIKRGSVSLASADGAMA